MEGGNGVKRMIRVGQGWELGKAQDAPFLRRGLDLGFQPAPTTPLLGWQDWGSRGPRYCPDRGRQSQPAAFALQDGCSQKQGQTKTWALQKSPSPQHAGRGWGWHCAGTGKVEVRSRSRQPHVQPESPGPGIPPTSARGSDSVLLSETTRLRKVK